MHPCILGIGTALPAVRISREQALSAASFLCAETAGQSELLESLYRQAGVESRHVVFEAEEVSEILAHDHNGESPFIPRHLGDPGPTTAVRMQRYEGRTPALAFQASRAALEAAGWEGVDVSHLVTVSCTGFAAPGFDISLIKSLNMKPSVERTHVGFMGCHGALNGLRVARGLIAADSSARVLLCAVELCSLHYHYGWNPKKLVGNALFADGAGAMALAARPALDSPAWRVAANGSCLFPDSEHAMAWLVRDHGFDMTLSTRVPGLIEAHLRAWLEDWLRGQGLAIGDVASWAIHPGGPRVLRAVEAALGLEPVHTETSRRVLTRYGNMSSATVLFILDALQREGAARPCVALGFGPGLTAEVALLR